MSFVVWLKTTELGNKTLGLLVLVFGVMTMAVMCGINYLWTPAEEIAESIQEDIVYTFTVNHTRHFYFYYSWNGCS